MSASHRLNGDKAVVSIFLSTAVTVVCGRGKSRLISGVYPEPFELRSSRFDGFKTRQIPESTNYR